MVGKITLLWLFLLLLLPLSAFETPPLTDRIVDQTGLLNKQEKAAVSRALKSFEKATGGQLFVAIVKPFEDASLEEAGIQLMDQWKPGDKGKDNGAILLIVPETRKIRLEIGYGWEGQVNDAKAGDIIRHMAPYFRKNDYRGGILAAINRLAYDITGKQLGNLPLAGNYQESKPMSVRDYLNFFAIAIIFLVLLPFARRRRRGGGGGFFSGGGGGGGGGRGGGGGGGGASGGW